MSTEKAKDEKAQYSKGLQAMLDTPKCGAKKRKKQEYCKAPAMANGRCRIHGGLNPGAPTGERNGRYKHGKRTKKYEAEQRQMREIFKKAKAFIEENDL